MTKYRLYTSDVAEGITDFNDDTYIIIHNSYISEYCLIIDTDAIFKPYIVAYKVEHHEYNSIDWTQEEYFPELNDALRYLHKKEYEEYYNKKKDAPG